MLYFVLYVYYVNWKNKFIVIVIVIVIVIPRCFHARPPDFPRLFESRE